jgi:hypothetical protein
MSKAEGILFFAILLVAAWVAIIKVQIRTEHLEKKISQYETLVLRCMSDQGNGYTVMLGREQIASFMCFPINTINVTK